MGIFKILSLSWIFLNFWCSHCIIPARILWASYSNEHLSVAWSML
jgi:hypothetical protein